jgi:hypothetical protein
MGGALAVLYANSQVTGNSERLLKHNSHPFLYFRYPSRFLLKKSHHLLGYRNKRMRVAVINMCQLGVFIIV